MDCCGRYTLVREIAHGGMGVVYEATTPEGEQRAIKMLKPQARLKPDIVQRFEREIQVLSYLDSAHVVRFYEAGVTASGELWVALEFLAGLTLGQIIKMTNGRLPIERIIRWGRQIAQGVSEAHRLSVIHRDLKPANIAIVDDVVKVFDFGIAKYRNWGCKPTLVGVSMGTLTYMAPEQFNGDTETIGVECDVYALGVILFELFSGRHPIIDRSEKLEMAALVFKILAQEPPKLVDVVPGFPPRLSEIVDKALAKKPEDRFRSMGEISDALAAVLRVMADKKRNAGGFDLLVEEETGEYRATVGSLHSDSIETRPIAKDAGAAAEPFPAGKLLVSSVVLPALPDKLVQVVGPDPVTRYELNKHCISIGRDEENDIDIAHASISRFHAKLRPLGKSRWEVVDSGSTNGVFINGVECRSGVIGSGDALEVGDVRLRFIPSGKHLRVVPPPPPVQYKNMKDYMRGAVAGSRGFTLRTVVVVAVVGLLVGFGTCVVSVVTSGGKTVRAMEEVRVAPETLVSTVPPPSISKRPVAPPASTAAPPPAKIPAATKRTIKSSPSDDWI